MKETQKIVIRSVSGPVPGDRENVVAHVQFAFRCDEWDEPLRITELSSEKDEFGADVVDANGKKNWKNNIVATIEDAKLVRVRDAQVIQLDNGRMLKVANLLIDRQITDEVLSLIDDQLQELMIQQGVGR